MQDNKGCRRECKEGAKKEKYDLNVIEKISIFFPSFLDINQVRTSALKFLYVTPCTASNVPTAIRYK